MTEHRGITLTQLLDLWAKIESLADEDGYLQGWKDRDGNTCHKDTVNLYDVVKYLVKPETAEKKCSYVELVAPPGTKAQTPKWFVSHWIMLNDLMTLTAAINMVLKSSSLSCICAQWRGVVVGGG